MAHRIDIPPERMERPDLKRTEPVRLRWRPSLARDLGGSWGRGLPSAPRDVFQIKPDTKDLILTKGAVALTTDARTRTTLSPKTVVSVLEKTSKDHPQVVKAYLEGLVCAAAMINDHPDEAVALLTKGKFFRVPPNVLKQAFASAPAPISFVPDVDSVQGVADDLSRFDDVKGKTRAVDIFRLETIRALQK